MLEWNILYTDLWPRSLPPPFLVNNTKIPPSGESRDGGESEIGPPPSDQKNKNSFF